MLTKTAAAAASGRYAPWWLSAHEFGNLHSGGQVHALLSTPCHACQRNPPWQALPHVHPRAPRLNLFIPRTGQSVKSYVPREVYRRFSPALQLLYRHVAEGEEDYLQPENQAKAYRARFVDQPALRAAGTLGDNSHVLVMGDEAMSPADWRRARGRL